MHSTETPILVTDLVTGIVQGFASKTSFRVSVEFDEYLARRRDFVIQCGCREHHQVPLYGRIRHGRRELCTTGLPWTHEWDCGNWAEESPTPPSRPLTRVSQSEGAQLLLSVQPLTEAIAKGMARGAARPSAKRDARRGPNTLASTLLYLIDATGLNQFDARKQRPDWTDAAACFGATINALNTADTSGEPPRVVARGRLLPLMDIPPYDPDSCTPTKPLRLLANITSVRHAGEITFVTVEGFHHEIEIRTTRWQYAMRRSTSRHTRRAVNALGGVGSQARVLAFFDVTRTADHDVVAHRAGICITSLDFIPVESSYELKAAHALAELGVSFIKDIYVPEGYGHRYDFRLFLEDGILILEVYGMDTKDYLDGKAPAENELVRKHLGRYLIWRAYGGLQMPRIPRFIAEVERVIAPRGEAI